MEIHLEEVEYGITKVIFIKEDKTGIIVTEGIIEYFGIYDEDKLFWSLYKDGRLIFVPRKIFEEDLRGCVATRINVDFSNSCEERSN